MEEKRYKAVYITKLDIDQNIGNEFYNITNLKQKIKKEIESDNIRILGDDFVKNNLNKAKLIINNKKNKLKGTINGIKTKDDKIKINILLNNKLVNFSHMFENSVLLKEISFYNKNKSNILDEEYKEFEIDNSYNTDYFDDNNVDSESIIHENSIDDYKFSQYSRIKRTERGEYNNRMIIR